MAVVQISRIQVRRGLAQDLPQLSSGEFGWAIDERKLYIGNGTTAEGAPQIGNTEILTQYSDVLALFDSYSFRGLEGGFEVLTGDTFLDRVFRSLVNKLDDFVNVRDFGAIGRGTADDTEAVVRALKNLYNNTSYASAPEQHRTIYFPAGRYKISGQVLKVLPWTRIKGDGKACTEIVQIDSAQLAVLRLVDNFNQTGTVFGTQQGSSSAIADQYQFEDIAIVNASTSTAPAVIVDGGTDAVFTRVRFDCGSVNIATLIPTTGHAGVKFTGASINGGISNFKFHQCDFVNASYGAEINNNTTKLSFKSCKFDKLYNGIVAGANSPDAFKPDSISTADCVFDNIKAEAIRGYASVTNISSSMNKFNKNIGRGGVKTNAPITPVIAFEANSCTSIADKFDRTEAELSVLPAIETNGYTCYIVQPDKGTTSGRLQINSGYQVTLLANQNNAISSISTAQSAILDYTLERDNYSRHGTMKISIKNGSVFFDEEYSETGSTNVSFDWALESGAAVLKYTSTAGTTSTFFYNLKFFK